MHLHHSHKEATGCYILAVRITRRLEEAGPGWAVLAGMDAQGRRILRADSDGQGVAEKYAIKFWTVTGAQHYRNQFGASVRKGLIVRRLAVASPSTDKG